MKIRYPVIISIILFVAWHIIGEIFEATLIKVSETIIILWFLSLVWVAYAILAKLCRTIYQVLKNKANRPEKPPLEP